MSKQYGVRKLLSELPDKGWELGSIDSLLKRIRKTGTVVQQPCSGIDCVRREAVEDLVLSQDDKPKRHLACEFPLNCFSVLNCAKVKR